MLEFRNVSKRFRGIVAVEDVSFSARAGEVTGYLGPNGSGKSTTMKMITGLIEMTSGAILFEGEPIQRDLIAYKQRMGYVPEEPHLYAHLSGLEYLVMVGQLRNLPPKPTAERIEGCCACFRFTATDMCRYRPTRKACAKRSCYCRAAPQSRPDPAGRALLRARRQLGSGVAQLDPGAGGTRQSGSVQLA